MKPKVQFFDSSAAFRAWLRRNHRMADEIHVGYFKKHTSKPSITWPESVAEALCYGWIDGIRRRIDDERYVIRFTPRRPRSKWSAVNVRLVAELEASGKMTQVGRAAFESRTDPKSKGYTYERTEAIQKLFTKLAMPLPKFAFAIGSKGQNINKDRFRSDELHVVCARVG